MTQVGSRIGGALFAAALLSPAAGLAATMTFDALPEALDPNSPKSYHENGIVAVVAAGDLGYYGNPGTAHLDDSGTSITDAIVFSAMQPFDFVSLEVFGLGTFYLRDTEQIAYDNVLIEGFRGGTKTGSELFSTGLGSTLVILGADLGPALENLDELRVANVLPFLGTRDGVVFSCADFPCGHINIDNLILEPVPVPPAGFMLLAAAGPIALAGRRRRAMPKG